MKYETKNPLVPGYMEYETTDQEIYAFPDKTFMWKNKEENNENELMTIFIY